MLMISYSCFELLKSQSQVNYKIYPLLKIVLLPCFDKVIFIAKEVAEHILITYLSANTIITIITLFVAVCK